MSDTPRPSQSAPTVEQGESDFGVVWSLIDGDLILDTYCPWNGDPRPEWMPDD